jgi:hypothetical protein
VSVVSSRPGLAWRLQYKIGKDNTAKNTRRGQRMVALRALVGSRRAWTSKRLHRELWACAQKNRRWFAGDPKAVELVKLDGQCIHAPGAHIAARASVLAGVGIGT